MTRRSTRILAALAAGFLVTPVVANLPVMVEIEDAYEVASGDVIPPRDAVGHLILKPCDDCDSVVLNVNARSQAFVGSDEVSFRELQEAATEASESPMYVFYTPDDKTVTRVVLDR